MMEADDSIHHRVSTSASGTSCAVAQRLEQQLVAAAPFAGYWRCSWGPYCQGCVVPVLFPVAAVGPGTKPSEERRRPLHAASAKESKGPLHFRRSSNLSRTGRD